MKRTKELALVAKSKAENDYANARTQQVCRLPIPLMLLIPCVFWCEITASLPHFAWTAPFTEAASKHLLTCAASSQEAERAEKAIKDAIAHLKEVVKSREPPPPNLDFQVR